MKVVHISDSHLGKVQFNLAEREDDFYSSFSRAVELAISEGPDLVIHTGDLFDSYRPHPRAFVRAFDSLIKLVERGIPIAIIEGNHELGPDVARRQITSPLVNLESLFSRVGYEKMFIRLNARVERIGDVVVAGLPYKSSGKDVSRMIEKLEEKVKETCRCSSILMIHQGVNGFIRTFHPELEFSDIARTSFDYVAMGHYHNKVVRCTGRRCFAYPGSTEIVEPREAFTSDGRRYILSVELGNDSVEVKELPLETRPFIAFSDTIKSTRDLYMLIERLKGSIVNSKERPIVYGKLRIAGNMRAGFAAGEIKRSLSESSLYVSIREKLEEEEELFGEPPHSGIEESIYQLIGSARIEREVRELAMRVFEIWYKEGKRGKDFVDEILRLVNGP
ncbi:MAG: DNA repair exonuclease [Candidatus Korarchaeum sp.]|nr:DNA repair exonuclease [Candidatus Korarchaeum sp.]MDW8035462.1 DNA repair exonuclease [Candidatus Korarchaeum sp.]